MTIRNTSGHIDGVKTKIQINKVRKQIWLHNLIFEKSNPENAECSKCFYYSE